jgi:hypothetical protein
MARGGGSGSGMMIMVILLLLLSSSALVGGYFYMNQEDTKEEVEDEFKLKYQEAARALEAERAAQQNVNVAKSALELAQEELELARLAFEGKEFANEAEKSAARARLYAAEQDVDTAAFRLSEAETDALTAASRRDTAEENANAALEIAITINTMIEANAVADANVMVTLAQGELDVAKRDWERIIGDANAAAANVMIAADAQAYAAYSRFMEAQNNFSAASTELQTAELELTAAEKREAAALIGTAAKLAVSIGAGNSVRCSANDVGGGAGAVYRVDGVTNVLRHYPNPEIAASWDPNYASAESIDCIGFAKGEDMEKNPAVVAAEAFDARVAALGDGNPVRCDTADVGAGAGVAVYRTTGTATLRHYPTAEIATSWDPDWATTTQGIDCTGFGLGAPMPMEPGVAAAAAAAAAAVETDGACIRECGTYDYICKSKARGSEFRTKTVCDAAGSDYVWKTTAQLEEERAARDAARDAAAKAAKDALDAAKAEADRLAGIVRGYKHPNLTGEMLEMTTSGNDKGAVGNDQMSSIYVPTGMWAQLFEHHDYGGRSIVYGPGTHNLSSGPNDDMTSYKIGTGTAPVNKNWQSTSGRSDPKLKDGINKIGTYEGLNVYEWTWNDIAMTTYGLKGREVGFLTTELDPEYVGKDQYGYEYIKDGTKISEAVKTVRATMK